MEGAIVLTALMIFIVVAVAAGRYAVAKSDVATAAASAARAASIERSAGTARSAAAAAAAATLNQKSVRCTPAVDTNVSGFNTPVGQAASVTTHVRCTVDMSDLTVPGLHQSITLTATASSPLDVYRERR